MKYKMVCIDMDGTLLNTRKKISSVNKDIIKKAHDMGVEIVVTTGRIYNNAAYFSKLLGVDSPVIAANGAIVIDQKTNNIIYECDIPKDDCVKILEILNKYKVFFQFNTHDTIYCNNWITRSCTKLYMTKQTHDEHLQIDYKNIKTTEQWKEIFESKNGKMAKCIVMSPFKSTIVKIRKELNNLSHISSFASGGHSLEINYKGASKGEAVKALISKYEIKKEEVICIGDNENDISMVKFAGVGIAMGNAIPELKKVANFITDSNRKNGVAKAINKFIINNKDM